MESVRNVYLHGKKWVFLEIVVLQVLFLNSISSFRKNATRRAVGESRTEVFSLTKNKPTHSFLSGPHVSLAVFHLLGMTAQLKFTVFYGPISMKERGGTPLLGLAKSIYYFTDL